ncbi:MAG TPA: hypothetical protein VIA62_09110 [Thermoanaerobaculia bacterium]|jgi:hypothetical protein|nr:hypothetical protein [Thermoanaerobaculia bacterium]
MKQTPSDRVFIVRVSPKDQAAASRRLAPLGCLQPLDGSDALLLSLRVPAPCRSAWHRAQEILGGTGSVQPVLIDETGEHHYPTGEISVRFRAVPDENGLRRFAADHGLRLLRRNEFVREQAAFQPLDGTEGYLPDLVQQIEREGIAKAVWANTLSHYQRALAS